MPEKYRDRLALVTSAFASKDSDALQRAVAEAELLDEDMTAEYGERQLCTISIREMRGWLAHLSGRNEDATLWYLHTTRSLVDLLGTDHELTRSSVRRCVATWLTLLDTPEGSRLAEPVLALAVDIEGEASTVVRTARKAAQTSAHTQPPA